jgi:hypothetical protein
MEKIATDLFIGVFIVIFSAAFGLLLAFPIMWCWNYAVTAIWGLPLITWGQAWCLNFLTGTLIKSTLTYTGKK